MDTRPIGFLDSGVGGLTVIKAVQQQLPKEQVIFIADQAHLPYGTKTPTEITNYVRFLVNFLEKQQVKLIVFACNTATAWALPTLQAETKIPLIGVIDSGVQRALAVTQTKKVGVIATPATIKSDVYAQKIAQLAPQVQTQSWEMPHFVPLVEENLYQTAQAQELVQQDLRQVRTSEIDTLILGCTHYPLLRPLIAQTLGTQIKLVDAGVATVQTLQQYLLDHNLQNSGETKKSDLFYTTGEQEQLTVIAQDWLLDPNLTAQKVILPD
ncbi:glutamate racemase [Lactobacillus sp. DCY120]|uniref:Glutamate racemase n=1 Tax=Bombilactobacillus apium TaxID=2675299 RepID=A0A850RCW4_9LACO|nr:glutamate racemase [Bombilactobacillus apium]NVY97126.1 glutamate racemase [Bombilactobacillus apium]